MLVSYAFICLYALFSLVSGRVADTQAHRTSVFLKKNLKKNSTHKKTIVQTKNHIPVYAVSKKFNTRTNTHTHKIQHHSPQTQTHTHEKIRRTNTRKFSKYYIQNISKFNAPTHHSPNQKPRSFIHTFFSRLHVPLYTHFPLVSGRIAYTQAHTHTQKNKNSIKQNLDHSKNHSKIKNFKKKRTLNGNEKIGKKQNKTHIYTYTYIHIYIYTYIHVYIYPYIHIYKLAKKK